MNKLHTNKYFVSIIHNAITARHKLGRKNAKIQRIETLSNNSVLIICMVQYNGTSKANTTDYVLRTDLRKE